jgi:hypothetical protein|tara:strand:+ start:1409 stop:1624 length:216 start_codon:yes stop_codon:yes gene_type:complete
MSVKSAAFNISNSTQPAQPKSQKIQIVKQSQAAVATATGTGGFGNKQAAHAFAEKKIIYRDILVHCVHNSI